MWLGFWFLGEVECGVKEKKSKVYWREDLMILLGKVDVKGTMCNKETIRWRWLQQRNWSCEIKTKRRDIWETSIGGVWWHSGNGVEEGG